MKLLIITSNLLIFILYIIYYPDGVYLSVLSRFIPMVIHCTLLFMISTLLFLAKKPRIAWIFITSALIIINIVLCFFIYALYPK